VAELLRSACVAGTDARALRERGRAFALPHSSLKGAPLGPKLLAWHDGKVDIKLEEPATHSLGLFGKLRSCCLRLFLIRGERESETAAAAAAFVIGIHQQRDSSPRDTAEEE